MISATAQSSPAVTLLDGSERVAVIESDGLGADVEVVTADRGDRLGAVRRVVHGAAAAEGC